MLSQVDFLSLPGLFGFLVLFKFWKSVNWLVVESGLVLRRLVLDWIEVLWLILFELIGPWDNLSTVFFFMRFNLLLPLWWVQRNLIMLLKWIHSSFLVVNWFLLLIYSLIFLVERWLPLLIENFPGLLFDQQRVLLSTCLQLR